jgi:alpha-amylase
VALRDWYDRVIAMRKEHVALRRGDFATLHAEGGVYSFLRNHPEERALVAFNNSRQRQDITIDLAAHGFTGGETFVDVLNGSGETTLDGTRLDLSLGPWGSAVLVAGPVTAVGGD